MSIVRTRSGGSTGRASASPSAPGASPTPSTPGVSSEEEALREQVARAEFESMLAPLGADGDADARQRLVDGIMALLVGDKNTQLAKASKETRDAVSEVVAFHLERGTPIPVLIAAAACKLPLYGKELDAAEIYFVQELQKLHQDVAALGHEPGLIFRVRFADLTLSAMFPRLQHLAFNTRAYVDTFKDTITKWAPHAHIEVVCESELCQLYSFFTSVAEFSRDFKVLAGAIKDTPHAKAGPAAGGAGGGGGGGEDRASVGCKKGRKPGKNGKAAAQISKPLAEATATPAADASVPAPAAAAPLPPPDAPPAVVRESVQVRAPSAPAGDNAAVCVCGGPTPNPAMAVAAPAAAAPAAAASAEAASAVAAAPEDGAGARRDAEPSDAVAEADRRLSEAGWRRGLPERTVHKMRPEFRARYSAVMEDADDLIACYFACALARRVLRATGVDPAWGGHYVDMSLVKPYPDSPAPPTRVFRRCLPLSLCKCDQPFWRAAGVMRPKGVAIMEFGQRALDAPRWEGKFKLMRSEDIVVPMLQLPLSSESGS